MPDVITPVADPHGPAAVGAVGDPYMVRGSVGRDRWSFAATGRVPAHGRIAAPAAPRVMRMSVDQRRCVQLSRFFVLQFVLGFWRLGYSPGVSK